MVKTLLMMSLLTLGPVGRADEMKSQAAYRKTLYAFFETKGCVRCHDGQKRFDVSGPAFASSDFEKSYKNVRRYIRFGDIANSWLVKKGGGGHWLNDYGYDCQTNAEGIAAMITAWWEGGEKDNIPIPKVTTAVAIPKAASADYTAIRWDLSDLASTPGTHLEMEVRIVPGTYQFRNPRLKVGSGAIQLQNLRILVNGKESVWRNRYGQLSKLVNADPWTTTTLLTTEVETVPARDSETDTITLQFARLEPSEPEVAKNAETFKRAIGPILEARHCAHCHDSKAKLAWRFSESAEALATQTLQRINRGRLEQSPWLALPARGEAGHPLIFAEDDYTHVLDSLRTWLNDE